MTDDPTRLPTPEPGRPEEGEQRLRKVLGAVDDLEPPRDDLFVQRALLRGRARTSRRRNGVMGAAAAVVIAAAVGGGAWVMGQQGGPSSTASAGSAQERAVEGAAGPAGDAGTGSDSGLGQSPTTQPNGIPTTAVAPGAPTVVPPAKDASPWFGSVSTPQRSAFESIEPRLVADYADVFAGAHAALDGSSRVVVTVTRHDPALESLVRDAMPSPGDVDFAVVANSYAAQRDVRDRVIADAARWRAKGIDITGVRIDGLSNKVVVSADEGLAPGALASHYGSGILSVEVPTDYGKRPDGTPATPQQ